MIFRSIVAAASVAGSGAPLTDALVKIRSVNPVSGVHAVASGLAFRAGGRGFVITSEHAVLNEPEPTDPVVVRFSRNVAFRPAAGPVATPPSADPRIVSMRIEESRPIEMFGESVRMNFLGERPRSGSGADANTYELRFADGSRFPARFVASDWGKGVTYLEFAPGPRKSLPDWESLRDRMSGDLGEVTIAGFPASSRVPQIIPGEAERYAEENLPLAEVDRMIRVADAGAEYGMSGGAAWDREGRYLGIVSHVTASGEVLVIPGDAVRDWTTALLTTGQLDTRISKDVSAPEGIYYTRGAAFDFFCQETHPCEIIFDLNARKNPAVDLPRSHADFLRKLRSSLEAAPRSARFIGFRAPATLEADAYRNETKRFSSAPEFFRLLRDPAWIPVVELPGAVPTDPEKRREIAARISAWSDFVTASARSMTATAREVTATSDVARLADQLARFGYRARESYDGRGLFDPSPAPGIAPAELDAFTRDPRAMRAIGALERAHPGFESRYRAMAAAIRALLARFIFDPGPDPAPADSR